MEFSDLWKKKKEICDSDESQTHELSEQNNGSMGDHVITEDYQEQNIHQPDSKQEEVRGEPDNTPEQQQEYDGAQSASKQEETDWEYNCHRKQNDAQIIAEIVMSAGPRKEYDSELGEDSAGVLLTPNIAFFWVADGTSECPLIKSKNNQFTFSARVLAQHLGIIFREHVVGSLKQDIEEQLKGDDNYIRNILEISLHSLLQQWNEALEKFLAVPENREKLDNEFKTTDVIDYSTTFICGAFTKTGELQIAQYGDCFFSIKKHYSETFTLMNKRNPFRFFMRLTRQNGTYQFITSKNDQRYIESHSDHDIQVVIACSDGVGDLLHVIEKQAMKLSVTENRNRIHKFIPKTYDDKTFCILSREIY